MLVSLLHVRRLAANDKAISMERSWTLTISAATFNLRKRLSSSAHSSGAMNSQAKAYRLEGFEAPIELYTA